MTSKKLEVINGMWKKHNHSQKKEGRKEGGKGEWKNMKVKKQEKMKEILKKTNSKI